MSTAESFRLHGYQRLFITNICAYQARQYYVVSGSLLTFISQVCMVLTCTSS